MQATANVSVATATAAAAVVSTGTSRATSGAAAALSAAAAWLWEQLLHPHSTLGRALNGLFQVAVSYGIYSFACYAHRFSREHQFTDMQMLVFGSFILHQLWFWTINIPLTLTEMFQWPAFLQRYKVQPNAARVTWAQFRHCVMVVLVNQHLVLLPAILLSLPLQKYTGVHTDTEPPSFLMVLAHLVPFTLIHEVFFYYSHRAFHWGVFYQWFHKLHHRFTAPISMACEYAHPVEMFVANVIPLMVGPVVCGAHVVTIWYWVLLGLLGTSTGHSGFELPCFWPAGTSLMHDLHHEQFRINFGMLYLLDRVHGTFRPPSLVFTGLRWHDPVKAARRKHLQQEGAAALRCAPDVDAQLHED